ncbi:MULTISPECIES: hypothetical protein [Marinobacter]|jgi:hypothetical protein|uniref:PH domain-containing protein n=2 Tax=Marinobacter TaxID=2742 RepID=A0ABZ3E8N0_9GAMM|nr:MULTISPECIES: hypothetical protein [Marinobacter]MAI33389.1 hypothetical protein [Rhodopirellula sp.]GGE77905.1 hypothetical protein GCM10011533_32830 [Streptosporangium jomthongense]AKV98190.1 hypothetical protein ACP86_19755 [Marinobacter sp. CP1]AZR43645.1 hypothetical protein MTMN5_04220 [Marinobacter salarius]ODM31476.1 hypothetical protein A6779_18110 [Marinobacter adhaerens]|tara:strand:- start:597 stop:1190 length:594 start_codon:yes stop_codon:yes gene_type:complete
MSETNKIEAEANPKTDPLDASTPVSYDNEEVVWEGSPSQIVNLGGFIFWGLVFAAAGVGLVLWNAGLKEQYTPLIDQVVRYSIYGLLIVGVLNVLMSYLTVKCERTVITRNKIKEAKGITSIFRQELFCEMSEVSDIKSPPAGLMGLFGLSTLVLETKDADQPIIRIRAIRNRDELVQKILPIWRKLKMDRKGYFGD